MNPEVSMPVLYFPSAKDNFGGGKSLAATIASVLTDQSGYWSCSLTVSDASGLVWNRVGVPFHAGTGNGDTIYGVSGGFCEFPQWFIKLMTPAHIFDAQGVSQ